MFYDVVRENMAQTVKYPEKIVKFAFIPENYPQPNPETQYIKIAYNHRLQDYKNYLTTFEMLAQLWTTHKNFRVMVTNPNAQNFSKISHYPFVEGKSIANHDQYLKELSTCHLNITNTQHETFCISALESLAFGQILVAPKAMTFPELVPPNYPYLFTNEEEQYRILDKLLTNPTFIEQARLEIMGYTRTTFADYKIGKEYVAIFNQYADREWSEDNFKGSSAGAFQAVRTKNQGFTTLSEIQRQLSHHNLGKQAMPLLKIKRILNKMGFEDEVKGMAQGVNFGI